MLHQGLTGHAARARIVELLSQVGIPDPAGRLGSYPHQLSGGQRQRVMIAMALANEPDLLIADEPTTALDVTVQAQILKLLKDTQTSLGMSMLFITHDLGIVRKLADRVCVMQRGKIVEQGEVERVFTAPEHPYTQALLAAEPKPDPAPPCPEAPVVVETKDLKVWFPIKRGVLRKVVGHIKAVDGLSIELRKGETLGVVGESGSGKTTLGLAILRLISSTGPIVFMGNEIDGLKFKQMRPFRHNMQIVFQDPYGSLSPRMSVSDIIEEGLWVHHPGLSRAEREKRVVDALTDVGLDPQTRYRYPHEFSGGQRQRIAVARALVLEPTFIVLDEPTSALDMLIQSQMVDLLRDLQKRHDLTYMFISHDLRVVAAMASRLLVMRHGKMVEEGAAAELFKAPKTEYTRALFAAAFKLETAPEGAVAQSPRSYALNGGDLAAHGLDTRDSFRSRLDCHRHVMCVRVDEVLGVVRYRHVVFPEDEIAAAQACERRKFSKRQFLHVTVARAGDAGRLKRHLHEARAVEPERSLAAPQIGAAEKLFGH
jgi:microcin C transport system ATP-binding protein